MLDPIWVSILACPIVTLTMIMGILIGKRIGAYEEQERAAKAGVGRWAFGPGRPTTFIYEGED